MASFVVQLKDMFFALVERVTGYGGTQEQHAAAAGAQEPANVVKHTEIRARGEKSMPDDVPDVPRGSLPQVHTRIL
ncbi:hypothetical protein EJB05_39832 [Eragrostis curvula]|uniref:Uncharacterized protein n=1 Tax=Eragrostis curvula TaxID=38414 RepID=A0A5J9TZH8_9POAL|nr:hypothetical protein EJB05_39832 [Eragrostis curvula]